MTDDNTRQEPAPGAGLLLDKTAGTAARSLPRALVLGTASGMRTFTPSAVLMLRGDRGSYALRRGAGLLAGGEILADKTPVIPPRTAPASLAGRAGSGAFVGAVAAGPAGAALGAGSAAAAAFLCERLRALVVARSGLPDPVVAIAEDLLALGLALAASGERGAPAKQIRS